MILLGITILLSGCSLGNHSLSSKDTVEAPPKISYAKSDAISADIYLDGTTSMYGYVNYPGGTIYADAVKDIDRTITENWKNDSIKYIKFGDNFQEMDRDAFLHMDNPDFIIKKILVCKKLLINLKKMI